jgi:ABC-type multidrug transport system ATPase subunit
MSAILQVDSVAKRFGRRTILSAASLDVGAGRVVVLFGRNGSGKTTLIRIITGFLRADSGHMRFLGRRRSPPRLAALAAEGLFYIPDRELLTRVRPVADHFELLHRRFGLNRAAEAIERMGIGDLLERSREQLSSGEARRAEIALALAREPVCLIADEPFHGVAPRDAEIVAAGLRELAARGAAVLVTGHEVETMLGAGDTVIWMTAGTTHILGTPDEARVHDQFRREYLGPGRRLTHASSD